MSHVINQYSRITLLFFFLQCLVQFSLAQPAQTAIKKQHLRFNLGPGKAPRGFISVLPETVYNERHGYGFEPGPVLQGRGGKGKDPLTDGWITSSTPFYFSAKVPEGNYRVRLTLGSHDRKTDAAIRVECRRMMINRVQTQPGEFKTVEFTVHVRDSLIRGLNKPVKLKPREREYFHWDDKLTIEFNGQSPGVSAIEIFPEPNRATTVFLAGNSTVVDQAKEPYASWGQMIPAFFKPGTVAIANYAESGESLRSFFAAGRFDKILSLVAPGDYAFVEFGHNDQKHKGEGIGAFTSYKSELKRFVQELKKKGATPVVVTPLQRRQFDGNGSIVETLGDYPAAARQLASEEGIALIDLNAMSKVTYEAWGVEKSLRAFVHYPANTFPGQAAPLADNTHFSPYGAFEMARLVVKGIRDNKLKLARQLKDAVPVADPARPGSYDAFYWPLSPLAHLARPNSN